MRLQKQQKTTNVEVRVVISPPSGEDPMKFRVAMYEWQLQDMLRNTSYAEAVFEVFTIEVCERLKLNAKKCSVKVNLDIESFSRIEDDAIYTGDVFSETLFLH